MSLLNKGTFNFQDPLGGSGVCSSRRFQKSYTSDWLKLTFLHENRDKIDRFSLNFHMKESRYLHERTQKVFFFKKKGGGKGFGPPTPPFVVVHLDDNGWELAVVALFVFDE